MDKFRDEIREELNEIEDESRRDAEAVLDQAEAEGLRSEDLPRRRWHDHTVVYPLKLVVRFIGRNGRRIGVTIAGFGLILIGIALLVLPGPGWLVIFAGLAVLSTEYVWAQRMLNKAKEKAQQAKDKVLGKKDVRAERKATKQAAKAERRTARS